VSESYRDLVAWQRAMALVTEIYKLSANFPKNETYGLTAQVRKAAVSIPSNIAEGKGRDSKKEYVMFLYWARGSLLETETQAEVALNLEYISREAFEMIFEQCAGVGRVLNGLIKSIERQIQRSPKSQEPRPRT
jgi:four helix bundle protein